MSCFPWLRAALLLFPALLSAQGAERHPACSRCAWWLRPTSVTDHSGNFINGLTAADFLLWDNDVPQQVHEDGDFLPISLAIAVQDQSERADVERSSRAGPAARRAGGRRRRRSGDLQLRYQARSPPGFHAGSRAAHARVAPHRILARVQPCDRCCAGCHASPRTAARRAPAHSAADLRPERSRQPAHLAGRTR